MEVECVIHDGEQAGVLRRVLKTKSIPYHHIELEKLTGRSASSQLSDFLLAKLDEYKVDYCFCFGSRILRGEILQIFDQKIINFHPSLLPSFPGLHAIDQALEYGVSLLGNTAHYIDQGVDTGAIIMQSILPAHKFENYDSVLDLQLPMLHQIGKWLEEGRLMSDGRFVRVDSAECRGTFFPGLEF